MTEHEKALNRLKLKHGDRVRVLRKPGNYEDGWKNSWIEPMYRALGKVFVVKDWGTDMGVILDCTAECGRTYCFPAHCLERVYAGIDCTIPE